MPEIPFTVYPSLSVLGGGSSTNWDSNYTLVNSTSANWSNAATTVISGSATWAKRSYSLSVSTPNFNPVDASTYYFGAFYSIAPSTTADIYRMYIPKSGNIKAAAINLYFSATNGSNENISLYIRLNNTTDVLIATVGSTDNNRLFSNYSLNTAVSAGDYLEMKMVCPTWATNPTAVRFFGTIYIEE